MAAFYLYKQWSNWQHLCFKLERHVNRTKISLKTWRFLRKSKFSSGLLIILICVCLCISPNLFPFLLQAVFLSNLSCHMTQTHFAAFFYKWNSYTMLIKSPLTQPVNTGLDLCMVYHLMAPSRGSDITIRLLNHLIKSTKAQVCINSYDLCQKSHGQMHATLHAMQH